MNLKKLLTDLDLQSDNSIYMFEKNGHFVLRIKPPAPNFKKSELDKLRATMYNNYNEDEKLHPF